jgi:hypothetical protein
MQMSKSPTKHDLELQVFQMNKLYLEEKHRRRELEKELNRITNSGIVRTCVHGIGSFLARVGTRIVERQYDQPSNPVEFTGRMN